MTNSFSTPHQYIFAFTHSSIETHIDRHTYTTHAPMNMHTWYSTAFLHICTATSHKGLLPHPLFIPQLLSQPTPHSSTIAPPTPTPRLLPHPPPLTLQLLPHPTLTPPLLPHSPLASPLLPATVYDRLYILLHYRRKGHTHCFS